MKSKPSRFYSPSQVAEEIDTATKVILATKVYPVIEDVLGEAQSRTKYNLGLYKTGTATRYFDFAFKCNAPRLYVDNNNWYTLESFVRHENKEDLLSEKQLKRRARLQELFPDLIELFRIFTLTQSLPGGMIRSVLTPPRKDDGTVDPVDYIEDV